jgi:hypothetical protein
VAGFESQVNELSVNKQYNNRLTIEITIDDNSNTGNMIMI